MTEADLAELRERLAASRLRVLVVDMPTGGRVVVKRQRVVGARALASLFHRGVAPPAKMHA